MLDHTDPIFIDATAAREHLERIQWPDGPVCPFCGEHEDIRKLKGKSHRPGLYKCRPCRKPFTVTVGTVMERSKVPLHKWVYATHLLCASKKGMSAHQLHRMLGVTYKTAWFMAHRIRESFTETDADPLGGEGKFVEADETFIGRQDWMLTPRGWVPKKGAHAKYKVVTLVERKGRARSVKVDKLNAKTIREVLVTTASRDSILATDEARHYKRVGKEFASHLTVNHKKREYIRGLAGTNTVEGFFSIFKRGMTGVYQHCAEQHLQRYLAEFDFRYSHRKITDAERRDVALKGIEGKRLTYRRISSGAESRIR